MPVRFSAQVDFDGDGVFQPDEDVSGDLLRVEFDRGRGYSAQTQWRSHAGRARIRLRNATGLYSPSNRDGPHHGEFLPGRRMRILWQPPSGGPMQVAWSGFTTAYDAEPSISGVNTATIRAEGPLAVLNRRILSLPGSTSRTAGEAIGAILDAVSWPSGERSIDAGVLAALGLHWVDGQTALRAMREVEATEGGVLLEGRDGSVVYHGRRRRLLPPFHAPAYSFGDFPGALGYDDILEDDGQVGLYNRFEAGVPFYTTADAEAQVWSSSAVSERVGVNESITIVAQGAGQTGIGSIGTATVGVLSWRAPTAGDFEMRANADGTGARVPLEVTGYRAFFTRMEVDLRNTGNVAGFVVAARAFGRATRRDEVRAVPGEAPVSIATYGPRELILPARFFGSLQDARDYIGFVTEAYKDPTPRLTMRVRGDASDALGNAVVGIDVPTRLDITAANAAGLGVQEDFFVERERHIATQERHQVTYDLSPATGQVTFWLLGVATLGVNTRLA